MDLNTFRSSLPLDVEELAKQDIYEQPHDREEACRVFYEWIRAQPHLSCPGIDTRFILMFLRGAKWSQLRAQEMLEGWLTMKTEFTDWFLDINPEDSKIQAIVDSGYMLKLPKRDKDGCQLIILRHGQLDADYKTYSHADVYRTNIMMGMLITRDEVTQVCGVKYVVDFTGCTRKHITNLVNLHDLQRFSRTWRGNSPGRQRGMIAYNAGAFFEWIMSIVRPFMPKKYQDRLKVCNSAENLYKAVPAELLPLEYLPDDYKGPHAGTVQEVIDKFKAEVTEPKFMEVMRTRMSADFNIDRSRKTSPDSTSSFRKLNVD